MLIFSTVGNDFSIAPDMPVPISRLMKLNSISRFNTGIFTMLIVRVALCIFRISR